MTVLVTGGAGYVGSVTVKRLLEAQMEVVVLDNLTSGHRTTVPKNARLVVGDVGAARLVRKVLGDHRVTAVVHLAGDPLVEKSMHDPGAFFRNNVSNGIVLLEAMRECGCTAIVFSSTCAVFGEPERTPIEEDHPMNPVNPYGRSKLMFEQILDWYNRCHGLRFMSLRYFNAAGATGDLGEDHRPETHLLPILCDAALGRRALKIFGNDYPTLDAHPAGIFNLGAGRGVSNLELLRAVERASGHTIPFEFAARRPGDPAVLVAAGGRARATLGWQPRRSDLETIVRSTWEWRQRHPAGYGTP